MYTIIPDLVIKVYECFYIAYRNDEFQDVDDKGSVLKTQLCYDHLIFTIIIVWRQFRGSYANFCQVKKLALF